MLKHQHFGKVKPRRHTSYAALIFLLLVAGVLLLGMSFGAEAAPPAVNPQSGSIGLTGTVQGPAPSTAPTLLLPKSGSTTLTIPISVSGTCPVGSYVDVTRNGVYGGTTPCADDGTYTLLVDLFAGQNVIVARIADALGQLGPVSQQITVFYNAPQLNLPAGSAGQQLFIQSPSTVAGGNPNEAIGRTITVVGGIGPYAVSWDWGDGATNLMSEAAPGDVQATHSYQRPGTYQVVVRVTDSTGNSAYLQVVTVVNGPAPTFGAASGSAALPGILITAWPLYSLAVIMVMFFWLGERRELHKLRKRHLLF